LRRCMPGPNIKILLQGCCGGPLQSFLSTRSHYLFGVDAAIMEPILCSSVLLLPLIETVYYTCVCVCQALYTHRFFCGRCCAHSCKSAFPPPSLLCGGSRFSSRWRGGWCPVALPSSFPHLHFLSYMIRVGPCHTQCI
jgi:hypothetical protein